MKLRFLKDYRSRQWMCRFGAGAEVEVDRPEVLAEVLAEGFAVPVDAPPVTEDAPAEPTGNNDGEDDGA